jgi:hypothetical protein
VYADVNGGTLQVVDQALSATTPAATQLSNLSIGALCGGAVQPNPPSAPTAPVVLNDYANPANSLLVYRATGCGSQTDTFTELLLNTSSASAPLATGSNIEPVDAVRDATGAIKYFLVIVHSVTGAPNTSQLGVVSASAFVANPTATPTIVSGGNLQGYANTSSSGDFQSIAVIPQSNGSTVWLWRDLHQIYGANIAANGTPSAIITVFAPADTDLISTPAYVDGTNVYLALTDTTNVTNRIVLIDTTTVNGTSTVSTTNVLAENNPASLGIKLFGVAGSNLIYATTLPSAGTFPSLYAVSKTANNAASGTVIWSQGSATQSVEVDSTSAPVVAGSSVYFTVFDSASSNAAPTQAYWYSGSGTASKIAASTGSMVIGGAVGSPFTAPSGGALNAAAPNASIAVIATFANAASAAYGANMSLSGASIYSYDGSGNSSLAGVIPVPSAGTLIQTATLSDGLLQQGMPALLHISGMPGNGSNESGYPADDEFVFVPGNAGLNRITTNLQ